MVYMVVVWSIHIMGIYTQKKALIQTVLSSVVEWNVVKYYYYYVFNRDTSD